MSQKDYKAIAEAIRLEFESVNTTAAGAAVERLAKALCKVFINDNPRFNPSTFLAACGIQP